jgi:hypothetical protein
VIHNFIHEHDTPPDPWLTTTPNHHGSPEYDGDNMDPQVYAGTEGNTRRRLRTVVMMMMMMMMMIPCSIFI